MKITGSMNYIKIDLENGYVMKAEGEMLLGRQFVVYKNTMKSWEAPHKGEPVTEKQIEDIVQEIRSKVNQSTVQIIFE